jgi:catechol 2,3-dioxygenase-like lactoylglutathione lyase family enzyme
MIAERQITMGSSYPERVLVNPPSILVSVREVPRLNALGIVVSDMARSISFYRLLGVDVPETPDEAHIDTFLPNGVRFMLDSEEVVRSFRPDWQREAGNQLALAFECETPAEVDEAYARVTAAGFHGEKEPWDAFWGQRYAQLQDPDGVPVDLYAAL